MSIENFNQYLESYQGISYIIKTFNFNDIVLHVAELFHVSPNELLNYPMGGYSKGQGNGAYAFVLKDMQKNITRYDQVYDMLADDISKEVFTNLMRYRLVPDIHFIRTAADTTHPQYFDKDILSCTPDEIFVDCGGFTGDTTEEFIRQFPEYKRIYIYEPSDDNIETCRNNLNIYSNVIVRNCGVGENNCSLPISDSASASSFIGTHDEDAKYIQIVSLDEDICETVSYIKMDIEGFEIPALLGAKNHIKNDTPKLAVCTYHIISDMWEIPLLINSINPNYDFYFRHYEPSQNWETVLYALPKKKIQNSRRALRAVAFPDKNGWLNVELIKDCGLIPYLLHKNHGMQVTFVGAKTEEYSNLQTYLPGAQMYFLPTGSEEEKVQYLSQHGEEIDCLILRGAYDLNISSALAYKKVNPKGKIYMGLDANSHWMDRIRWDLPNFTKMLQCCDVIATSCKLLQTHLNEKWPWKIEYLPNGYYGFEKPTPRPDFSKKENTILTVSRLGTAQKATNVLLEAFASIAERVPDWNLKLVGSVEESFQPYLDAFFQQHPDLTSRIVFTGAISDKAKLMDEYQRAKIFTLTSTFEGGPNVIAEALTAGCVMAVTKFDAWNDAIDNGRCGLAVNINDIPAVSNMLLSLCQNTDLNTLSENAYQYALRNYDMENITAKLYEMLFGGN